jgi:hypothetical protein
LWRKQGTIEACAAPGGPSHRPALPRAGIKVDGVVYIDTEDVLALFASP